MDLVPSQIYLIHDSHSQLGLPTVSDVVEAVEVDELGVTELRL